MRLSRRNPPLLVRLDDTVKLDAVSLSTTTPQPLPTTTRLPSQTRRCVFGVFIVPSQARGISPLMDKLRVNLNEAVKHVLEHQRHQHHHHHLHLQQRVEAGAGSSGTRGSASSAAAAGGSRAPAAAASSSR